MEDLGPPTLEERGELITLYRNTSGMDVLEGNDLIRTEGRRQLTGHGEGLRKGMCLNKEVVFQNGPRNDTVEVGSVDKIEKNLTIIDWETALSKPEHRRQAQYTTNSQIHQPGAIMISCFLERTRRKVRSFVGSRSLTTLRALSVRPLMRPVYWMVVGLSSVLLMGIPRNTHALLSC